MAQKRDHTPIRFEGNRLEFLWGGRWLSSKKIIERKEKNLAYCKKKSGLIKNSLPEPEDSGHRELEVAGETIKRRVFTPIIVHEDRTYYHYEGKWRDLKFIQKRKEKNRVYHKKNKTKIRERKRKGYHTKNIGQRTWKLRKNGIWKLSVPSIEKGREYAINYYYRNKGDILAFLKTPEQRKRRAKNSFNDRRRRDPSLLILDAIHEVKNERISFSDFIEKIRKIADLI